MRLVHPWSFAISFGGNSQHLQSLVGSIRRQNLDRYEILVSSEGPQKIFGDDIRWVTVPTHRSGWITRKKNAMIDLASYNQVCVLHDYLRLNQNWSEGFSKFGHDWSVCSSPTLDSFRHFARVADWMTLDHPIFGLSLLPYDICSESRYMFISGMYYCVKKDFIENHNLWLDESLGWGESEDQEWSRRVRSLTHFSLNPFSTVVTQKPKEFTFLRPPSSLELMKWRISRAYRSFGSWRVS